MLCRVDDYFLSRSHSLAVPFSSSFSSTRNKGTKEHPREQRSRGPGLSRHWRCTWPNIVRCLATPRGLPVWSAPRPEASSRAGARLAHGAGLLAALPCILRHSDAKAGFTSAEK